MTQVNKSNEAAALIAELQQAGIKHTPENIVRIAKNTEGKILFLETGKLNSGMQHILDNHVEQFTYHGISREQIPDAIVAAVTQGKIIGYQGKTSPTPRTIYQFTFNGETKYIAVQVAENGYIVGANPRSTP